MQRLNLAMLLAFFIAAACVASPADDLKKRKDEKYLSLIQLIADPDKYHGDYVSIGGYLALSREIENSLYLDENSYRHSMPNSIAINFEGSPPEIKERAKELDRGYVIVAGRFKSGATALSLGELKEVYYIAPAPAVE